MGNGNPNGYSDGGTKHLLGTHTVLGSVLIFAHWVFEARLRKVNTIQAPPFSS